MLTRQDHTIRLQEIALEQVSHSAASLKESFSGDGRPDGSEFCDILNEAKDALQAAGQQRPDQALPILPVLLSPACQYQAITIGSTTGSAM